MIHPILSALGWAMLHSLWQITLIFVLYKALERLFGRHNGAMYRLAIASMAAAAVWACWTFCQYYEPMLDAPTSGVNALGLAVDGPFVEPPVEVASQADVEMGWSAQAQNWLRPYVNLFGIVWCLGALLCWLRLLGGYVLLQRLKSRARQVVHPELTLLHEKWRATLRLKGAIKLLESDAIVEPLTIGFLKPIVLFPASMVLRLSTAELEVLLLHELAHIKRHDYIVNIAQLILEVVFFYHPLFWLLTKEARARREYACDDMVVRHTTSPLLYAQTLTNLQIASLHHPTPFAMYATGNGRFTARILRIMGVQPQRTSKFHWIMLFLCPIIGFLTLQTTSITATKAPVLDIITLKNAEFNTPNTAPALNQRPVSSTPQPQPLAAPSTPIVNEAIPQTDTIVPPSTAPTIVVEAEKMNVFYIGVDNPINIAVPGYQCGELLAKIKQDGATLMPTGDCQYQVTVRQTGDVQIEIYSIRGGIEQLIGTKNFRTKRIPDPVPRINSYKGGKIKKADLLEAKEVSALMEGFVFPDQCEVTGFQIGVFYKDCDPVMGDNIGGTINATFRKLIQDMKPGDSIYFDDIKTKCPGDTNPRNIGSLAFKVVE
jgi:beta-lactamase regulating signal transducer with metallopeptidase domain